MRPHRTFSPPRSCTCASVSVLVVLLCLDVLSFLSQFVSGAPLQCLCFQLAMDPSQQQMHHHLARALMHLYQLAAFLPFFHSTPDWDSNSPPFSSHPGHIHPLVIFILLYHSPLDPRLQHLWRLMAAFHPTTYSIPNLIYVPFPTVQFHILTLILHHLLPFHLFPCEDRKDIVTTTRHVLPILHLHVQSRHHAPLHPDPCPFLHLHLILTSHPAAKAASSAPANPARPCLAPSIPSAPPNLDPAIVDHRNRPLPPCDDRELAQYKMDTKSRPSWQTIAKRMNRTAESCKARWQWLKTTQPELLNPGNATEAGDDGD